MPRFTWVFGALVALSIATACGAQPPSVPSEPAKPDPAQPAKSDKVLTADQKLDACAKMYAAAKTYRDEGAVHTELAVPGQPNNVSDKPFSTVFERNGRFLWEFRASAIPGHKPDQQFVVWSADQKKFHTYWDLGPQRTDQSSFDGAMAGPTGVSGGSATVVIPLLRPEMRWGVRTTRMTDAVEKGTEILDGTACTVIEGKLPGATISKLWLDDKLAIRKVFEEKEIDPAKLGGGGNMPAIPKFTSKTTITLKPVIDEKIDDAKFNPPAVAAKAKPQE